MTRNKVLMAIVIVFAIIGFIDFSEGFIWGARKSFDRSYAKAHNEAQTYTQAQRRGAPVAADTPDVPIVHCSNGSWRFLPSGTTREQVCL